MQTNNSSPVASDYDSGNQFAGSSFEAVNPSADQVQSRMIDMILDMLEEFPARASSDDMQQDIMLLFPIESVYPAGLSEEQIRRLHELDREAEWQMTFWQNRCDWFAVMRDNLNRKPADHAASEATEATVV